VSISRARSATFAGLCALLAVVALGATIRIGTALSLPAFAAQSPDGLLKSDTGLLYYITTRIIEGGGLPPGDFRSDPRIEHPETSDLPAMETVGEEFLVAWAHLLSGGRLPLFVLATIVMGVFASLAAIGVYGLALELTGEVRWAVCAVVLYAIVPANYRTIGFILIREDGSLPFFALHLWLLARAVRVRSGASIALAAVALVLALATWHAMRFFVTLEAACIFAWYLRTGVNPLAARRAWVFPAILAAGALLVPVLLAKWFVLSLAMQALAAMALAAWLEPRLALGPSARRALGLASLLACVVAGTALARGLGTPDDYSHVIDFAWSKLRFLGTLPADPNALSFGTRLLWQGPFATVSFWATLGTLVVPGVLLPVALARAAPEWLRGTGDGRVQVLMAFCAASIVAMCLVQRMIVLGGLLAPVAVCLLLRELRPGFPTAWVVGLGLVQTASFATYLHGYETRLEGWYNPEQRAELARVERWIGENLPHDAAIVADFVDGTGILVHSGNPIVMQPKYETRRSRDRIEAFLETLYQQPLPEFTRLLRERFAARYLLIDMNLIWDSRYQAGLPMSAWHPNEGTAAFELLNPKPRVYRQVPGFKLLYKSEDDTAFWRLYEVEAGPGSAADTAPHDP
jgi:hypothetical protein